MSESALRQAQAALQIRDVYLRSASLSVADSYEPHLASTLRIQTQYRHIVEKSEVLEAALQDGKTSRLFRIHLDLGFRWGTAVEAESSTKHEQDAVPAGREDFVELGRIEGKYVAEYEICKEVGPECLDEFALVNSSYHVWPFWREFVATSCNRLNIPKQVLPMFHTADNSDAARSNRRAEKSLASKRRKSDSKEYQKK